MSKYCILKNKALLLVAGLTIFAHHATAQLPVCSGPGSGLIYYVTGSSIYNLDPTQPLSATNPVLNTITAPSAIGIAVSDNINGPGPSPTFYTVVGANYHYYDGSTWVNTGHTSGAVNPGAGGGFLYSLVGGSGEVYKYNGTGNATLLITISDFKSGGPFDCVADCEGNFYILRTDTTTSPQYLRKYSPTGTLLQSWTVSGATSSISGGGMAVIGNKVYFVNGSGYWDGTISGTNVNFTLISTTLNPGPSDFSSCALGAVGTGGVAEASVDSLYLCDTFEKHTIYSVKDSIGDVIKWQVLNGTATIYGTGDTIEVSAKSNARLLLTVSDTSLCGSIKTDTVQLILLKAKLDAGIAETIIGCHEFTDTLKATLKDTTKGALYNITWEPQANVIGQGNTLTPIISSGQTTLYTITISTPAEWGGCVWTDTVTRVVQHQVQAMIDIADDLICTNDTALFSAGKSIVHPYSADIRYQWDFGDGNTADIANPKHPYATPGDYNILLIVFDSIGCADTAYDVMHIMLPPYISLGTDTSICDGIQLKIPTGKTDKNVVSYMWSDSSTESYKVISKEGAYILHVRNECGMYTDTFNLGKKDCSVWFPSGFTPNSDGLNDKARVRGKHLPDIANYNLIILNRFGERVFETTDVNAGWDGTYKGVPASVGTFYYLIQYKITGSDKEETMKGDLTLIR